MHVFASSIPKICHEHIVFLRRNFYNCFINTSYTCIHTYMRYIAFEQLSSSRTAFDSRVVVANILFIRHSENGPYHIKTYKLISVDGLWFMAFSVTRTRGYNWQYYYFSVNSSVNSRNVSERNGRSRKPKFPLVIVENLKKKLCISGANARDPRTVGESNGCFRNCYETNRMITRRSYVVDKRQKSSVAVV